MVDTLVQNSIAASAPAEAGNPAPSTVKPAFSVSQYSEISAAEHAKFCALAVQSPAQSPIWLDNWVRNVNNDVIFATILTDEKPAFSVALEIVSRNGLTIAQFPGGKHANGNFPAVHADLFSEAQHGSLKKLFSEIRHKRPDIDLLSMERQEAVLEGINNPLAIFATGESPNFALSLDLTDGFDAVLEQLNGKRKRKKHRNDTRKFEANGGFRIVRPGKPDEVDRLLDFFFEAKTRQFAKAGIENVFARETIRSFFRALFREGVQFDCPPFELCALEVGGKLLAVTGNSIAGKRMICDFAAIADEVEINASPGEFLHFENISRACADGFSVYDFSVGDEPYKRHWCTIETTHFDVWTPLSMKGRMIAAGKKPVSMLKRMVKRNDLIWRALKTLRAKLPANS